NLLGLAFKHRGAMPENSRWSQRSGNHRKTAQKLFRWYRCAQPPATLWQPFGLQPPLVVGVQKLRCAPGAMHPDFAVDSSARELRDLAHRRNHSSRREELCSLTELTW